MADEQEKEVPVTVNEPQQQGDDAQAQAPEAEAPSQPTEAEVSQPAKAEKAEPAPKAATPPKAVAYTARLKRDYDERIVPAMTEKFGYKNRMEVPRLDKIVINVGLGEAIQNSKALDAASTDVATITGQKPVITKAKKSIASSSCAKACRSASR